MVVPGGPPARSFREAWRRDPAQHVALALILAAAIGAVFVLAFAGKVRQFERSSVLPDATYWMESAQRFRYVRMVAAGEPIPDPDTRMQAPDGYPPWSDTVLQEVVYGRLAAATLGPEDRLAPFVRHLTRLLSASSVVPMALLAWAITRRRDAAVLAALGLALAAPFVERGTGAVLFREDVAVPVLIAHLAAVGAWARSPRALWAVAAGATLGLALLLWKVVPFLLLLELGLIGVWSWVGAAPPRALAGLALAVVLPGSLLTLLPLNLAYDRFATSTPSLLGWALAAALVVPVRSAPRWAVLAGALGLAAVLRLALPDQRGVDHAWATIAARLVHLGQKPLDPTELGFHARHYWTGNYESPGLADLLRSWPPLLLAALPGAAAWWRWRRPGPPPEPRWPRSLIGGLGPMPPLCGASWWFVVWLAGAWGGSYLIFRKFQLLAVVPLVLLGAIGWARGGRGRVVVLAGLLGSAGVALGALPGADRLLPRPAGPTADPVVVFSARSFDELAAALPGVVPADAPVLASFIVSPFVLTYCDRPVVLHCFFEGDLLPRLQEVITAQFADEATLAAVARRYGARYYLHEAHHLLRTDRRMAQRYVAAAMEWPAGSAMAAMSYAPEALRHFDLVWENAWFRLFEVREQAREPQPPRASAHPAWSRPLFASLFGDPLGPVAARADGVEPADLLYGTLWAEAAVERARTATDPRAELTAALRVAPWFAPAHDALAALGGPDSAAQAEAARGKAAALRGERPWPVAPIPLRVERER